MPLLRLALDRIGCRLQAAEGRVFDMLVASTLRALAVDGLKFHLRGLEGVRVYATPATGLYFGSVEPSLGLEVTFPDGQRERVLGALVNFAEQFQQEQFHVRHAPEAGTEAGHVYADGSYNTFVVRFLLAKPLGREEVQAVIDASGLPGLTITNEHLEAYYLGDATDVQAIADFREAARKARDALGENVTRAHRGPARLWAYGSGYGATHPYAGVSRDVPAAPQGQQKGRRQDVTVFEQAGQPNPLSYRNVYAQRTADEMRMFSVAPRVVHEAAPDVRPSGMMRSEYARLKERPWHVEVPAARKTFKRLGYTSFASAEEAQAYADKIAPDAVERAGGPGF